ncbi:hypothetical protein MKX03_001091 [Papaver bracteatum]|nr:hypothetical protein MKX03_001091 [Papaver bracteatum]
MAKEVVVSSPAPVGIKNEGAIIGNGGGGSHYKKNRIQVSNTKNPLFFYVNLAKRYTRQHSEVELSVLGMELVTSAVDMKDENKGRLVQKAKLYLLLGVISPYSDLHLEIVGTIRFT